MAVRMKTRWHRSKRSERNRKGSSAPKSLQDLASAIAMNIWKLAKEAYVRMEKEGFRFREDHQAINVVNEMIIYQMHICDRMMYGKVEDQERADFINKLAQHLIQTVTDNQTELLGPGEHAQAFVELINERFNNYAQCDFEDNTPSFEFSRYLAQNIADIMSETDDKWVVEQVMDIEAPAVVEKITRAVEDVLGLRQR